MGRIFSHGKLMLTSEYFAIDGALVLAVATKPGQEFFFEEKDDHNARIFWEAYHQDVLWLSATIDYRSWTVTETNLPENAAFICQVLQQVQQDSSIRFKGNSSYFLRTNLQFPSDFGLGSSSTLMNNLSEWAEIDAFRLNEKCLGGSGYDIAVAKCGSSVLFQNKPKISFQKIQFQPTFKDDLIFIHLNTKQNSREGIQLYRSKEKSAELIAEFSDLTKKIQLCYDMHTFSDLMIQHEQKIADFLGRSTAKSLYFRDCPVFIKSLGAWGGDFVMSQKFTGYEAYFREKGFCTIFFWDDIID